MKKSLITTLLLVSIFVSLSAQQSTSTIIGSWKLIKSEALDKIKNSSTYASMPERDRKAFEAQADLLMQVSRYEFMPDNKLVYMDVEQSFLEVSLPVERKAIWELKNDIITIVETDRPFQRQMKIVTLTDSTLVVNLITNGVASADKVYFESIN
ncbi:lipocalin family protein [Pontibacter rugosus]|uniref:Lipocalin family protein n=1 Tax=Pontibacter rugosus TaxID=1745966 RepID=A0ABW3SNK3_9BACT